MYKSSVLLFLVAILASTESACGRSKSLPATWIRPSDEMVMIHVAAGEFEMGSSDADVDHVLKMCSLHYEFECSGDRFALDEMPAHSVVLDSFWIDRTEVTNAQYRQCVEAGTCAPPAVDLRGLTYESYYSNPRYSEYPVAHVTWLQAKVYCEWAGGRLPTEAEWEYAARGPERRIFSWGDEFDGTRLNYCDANCPFFGADNEFDDGYADTAPVGSYPTGASWCGALDMAGNVQEWVADWYAEYSSERQVNPTGPSSGEKRVVRGSAFGLILDWGRSTARIGYLPDDHDPGLGFRCAKDAE